MLRFQGAYAAGLARFLLCAVASEASHRPGVGTVLAVRGMARFLLWRDGAASLARNLLRSGQPSPSRQKRPGNPDMARKLLCTLPPREPCKAISVPVGGRFCRL